jgi:glycosyltransferase involved in cell wall biosynthesis
MKICMLAYAHYINDARIKCYVRTLEANGHSVDVVALRSDGEAATEARPSGTIFRVMDKYQGQSSAKYVWSYLKFFLKALFFFLRRPRYDVVHVHNMPNALVFAAIGPKLFGARVMLDVHDLMMANYMAKFGTAEGGLVLKVLKLEQRLSGMFADHVFCADHNQKDYLAEHCGIARDKITVLLNLPNEEIFKPVAAVKKSDVFRIVYHGTLAHRLGIDLILRAVARAAERVPVELYLYGAGDYLADALDLSAQLKLDQIVHFSRNFFPVEQIPQMVCGMDLGIVGNRRNPACDKYMLPVKLLEYAYLGIPVVAPRLEVIERYFDDTMVRYYEPENVEQMADAIVELVDGPEKRERQARAASAFYQKYNIKAQSDRYLNLLTASPLPMRVRPAERQL